MTNIDDKLREIQLRLIDTTWNNSMEGYNGEYDGLIHVGGKPYTEKEVIATVVSEVEESNSGLGIDEIKQAFKDAGYHQECPPKVTDGTLYPLLWAAQHNYKSGQEWYENYRTEWNKINAAGNVGPDSHIEAAQKASGIK